MKLPVYIRITTNFILLSIVLRVHGLILLCFAYYTRHSMVSYQFSFFEFLLLTTGRQHSTNSLNYIMVHNFQTEIHRREIKKIPRYVEYNTQSIEELNCVLSVQ